MQHTGQLSTLLFESLTLALNAHPLRVTDTTDSANRSCRHTTRLCGPASCSHTSLALWVLVRLSQVVVDLWTVPSIFLQTASLCWDMAGCLRLEASELWFGAELSEFCASRHLEKKDSIFPLAASCLKESEIKGIVVNFRSE